MKELTKILNSKTLLVTGGAGAIGSNLVKFLSGFKCKIVIVDDLSSGRRDNIPDFKDVTFYHKSILDGTALKRIFSRKIDYVFHLAAQFANQNSVDHPEEDLLTNALGTLKLLRYSSEYSVSRFVYASSSCVYGSGAKKRLREDFVTKLETPYAISKLAGEEYVHFFNRLHKLDTTVVRYFNAYGPGDPPGKYRNVIPNFFLRAMKKEPLIITGTGHETRDFTYMDDIVRGTVLTLTTDISIGQVYNIGTGREVKIFKLAELINKITGNTAGIKFMKSRKWDKIGRRLANIDKSGRHIGYKPQVSLKEGLVGTWNWFREKYKDEL